MKRLASLLAAPAFLLAASPSQAATLTGDQGCYQEGEAMNVVGNGFTPNGAVAFSLDNASFGAVTADAAGVVRAVGPAPRISPSKQRRFLLEARDAANPALAASINPLATAFGVSVKPKRGNPARKRTIKVRGFTDGRTLYVHVRRKGKGKNIKLGKLKRPCGVKTVRKRIFAKRAPTGVYTVQFDTQRRYSASAKPRVTFSVRIYRTVRASVAGAAFATGERWTQTSG